MPALKTATFSALVLTLVLLLGGILPGCDQSPPTGAAGKDGAVENKPLRIVSLSPALTQMIRDMGHGNVIVGVDDSHALVFDKLDVPTIGQYSTVSAEALIGLNPSHVLVMAGQEGPPAALTKQADANGFKVVTFSVPTNVREVIGILVGKYVPPTAGKETVASETSLASLLGDDRGGLHVANEMQRQMGRIAELADSASEPGKRPRVLVAFAVDPRVQAAGPQTVLDDVLRQYAGAYNASIPELKPLSSAELEKITDPEKRKAAMLAATEDPEKRVGTAPTFDREKLLEAKPEVVLLVLPGDPPLKSIEEDPRLADFRGLDIPAVKNNRIILISDKTALLPATGLPAVAAQMAKAIHPALAERIDQVIAPPKAAEDDKKTPDQTPGEAPEPPQAK